MTCKEMSTPLLPPRSLPPVSVPGVSTAGRRVGAAAAAAAVNAPLSRISEVSNESCTSVKILTGGGPADEGVLEKVRDLGGRAMANKVSVAVIVFLLTATLLCVVNPPMAREASPNPAAPAARSVKKIVVWSSLASGIALLLPFVMGLVKKGA